mmetsp:Transcript_17761/g.40583  ORF Transcript_17761/g.40583 Transcript_17761/m.40583 type:complete len:242 (+) Transcript_17761:402-1127(+)
MEVSGIKERRCVQTGWRPRPKQRRYHGRDHVLERNRRSRCRIRRHRRHRSGRRQRNQQQDCQRRRGRLCPIKRNANGKGKLRVVFSKTENETVMPEGAEEVQQRERPSSGAARCGGRAKIQNKRIHKECGTPRERNESIRCSIFITTSTTINNGMVRSQTPKTTPILPTLVRWFVGALVVVPARRSASSSSCSSSFIGTPMVVWCAHVVALTQACMHGRMHRIEWTEGVIGSQPPPEQLYR